MKKLKDVKQIGLMNNFLQNRKLVFFINFFSLDPCKNKEYIASHRWKFFAKFQVFLLLFPALRGRKNLFTESQNFFSYQLLMFFFLLFLSYSSILGNSDFFQAVSNGKLNQVKEFINQGININALDSNKRNALHIAVTNKRKNIIDLLLDSGIDLFHRDEKGKSGIEYLSPPELWGYLNKALNLIQDYTHRNNNNYSLLGICLLEKNIRCIDFLLTKGLSPNSKEGMDNLPLIQLAYRNNLDSIVKLLLEHGADPNEADSSGNSLFHLIAERGDMKTLSRFNFPYIDQKNSNGDTPFHLALNAKHINFSLQLLNINASSSLPNNDGITPFHLAVKLNSKDLIRKMIPNVFDIDDRDNRGDTPLIYAIESGQVENVKIILSEGGNPIISGYRKLTPIVLATEKNIYDMCKALIDSGVDTNLYLPNGKHLSYLAIDSNNLKLFQLFIENLDINKIPLLHYAAKVGRISFMQHLIEKGAELERLNKSGETPLFAAVQEGNKDAVNFLLKKKANKDVQNFIGESLLHRAIYYKQSDIIELLLKEGTNSNILDNDGNNLILQLVYLKEKNFESEYLLKIIDILKEYKVKINARNYQNKSPVTVALEIGDISMILGLAQMGGDFDHPNVDGSLPLERLITRYLEQESKNKNYFNLIKTISKNYSNINLNNSKNRNILSEIIKNYNSDYKDKIEEIVKFLIESGIKVTSEDHEGNSTLYYAKNTKNNAIISLIENEYKNSEKENQDWSSVQYGTSSIDEGLALDTNAMGNHLLLGLFGNETKLFLLNSKGTALWQMNYDGAKGAAFDSLGNIYVAGFKTHSDPEFSNLCEEGKYKIPFIIKMDNNGSEIETNHLKSKGFCGLPEHGKLLFNDKGFYYTLYANDFIHIYFVGLDGKIKWSNSIFDSLKEVKLSHDGNLYLIARSFYIFDSKGKYTTVNKKINYGLVDLNYTKSGNLYSIYEEEVGGGFWLIKSDQKGKEIWNRFIASGQLDTISQIQLDSQENIHIIGVTNGRMHGCKKVSDFDDDIFLMKYDSNGKRLWTAQFGSDGDDKVKQFQIKSDRYNVVLGSSKGKIKGGTFQGGEDITVFKISINGEAY